MQDMTLDTLSQVSGRDRWSLSRDFRTLYGTSPWRYVMMRRLDFAASGCAPGNVWWI
nr:Uncharacterised protein [Klebsiella pneumoniae]